MLLQLSTNPVSVALNPTSIAIGIFVVCLYITTTILEFKILDKLQRILDNQSSKNHEEIEIEKERVKAIAALTNMADNIQDNEYKIDGALEYLKENKVLIDGLMDDIKETEKQITIMGAALVNQTQSTNRVIDSLLNVINHD